MVYQCRAQQRAPRYDLVKPGSALAIDCEGVLLTDETGWEKNGCGRVSIVNENEEVVYDVFAHYGRHVNHRPPPHRLNLGVKYKDIKPWNGAIYINEVTRAVTRLFDRAGTVVGHAIQNEMQYLRDVPWEKYQTRDTQTMGFYQTGSMKLRVLAGAVLGRSIQGREHSSVEDAQATMALYLSHKDQPALMDLHDSGIGSGSDETDAETEEAGWWLGTVTVPPSDIVKNANPSLEAHRASIPRSIAPGQLVALPYMKGIAQGRKFDARTSTYY